MVKVGCGDPLHVLATVTFPTDKVFELSSKSSRVDYLVDFIRVGFGRIRWWSGESWSAWERGRRDVWHEAVHMEDVMDFASSQIKAVVVRAEEDVRYAEGADVLVVEFFGWPSSVYVVGADQNEVVDLESRGWGSTRSGR